MSRQTWRPRGTWTPTPSVSFGFRKSEALNRQNVQIRAIRFETKKIESFDLKPIFSAALRTAHRPLACQLIAPSVPGGRPEPVVPLCRWDLRATDGDAPAHARRPAEGADAVQRPPDPHQQPGASRAQSALRFLSLAVAAHGGGRRAAPRRRSSSPSSCPSSSSSSFRRAASLS